MEDVVKIAGNLELLVLNFSFIFSTIRFFGYTVNLQSLFSSSGFIRFAPH